MRRRFATVAVLALAAEIALGGLAGDSRAAAGVPRVVADIAPVHSLIAAVMEGIAEPVLLVPAGASPHDYALRPSAAREIARADLIFWVGAGLTPWLADALATLGEGARRVPLMDAPGIVRRAYREGAGLGAHDGEGGHVTGAGGASGPAPASGSAPAPAPGKTDPHIWLDPLNGARILDIVAGELARADPANAPAYRANAAAARARIAALTARIDADLAPLRGRSFVVLHDAYGHFEARFGVRASGALLAGEAVGAGAARVAQLREIMRRSGAVCLFISPQFNPRLAGALTGGSAIREGRLDPMGIGLTPGPGLYGALLRAMARNMAECLSAGG